MEQTFIQNILQSYKTCKECKETKEKFHFENHRAKCKMCTSARKRNFYNDHKEQWKKYYKYTRKTMPVSTVPQHTVE